MKAAIFLDRDGVIVRDNGYVHRTEDFELLPGVVPGLREFQTAGYLLVVVTNQSGIARGLFSEDDYLSFTKLMRARLAVEGITFDAVLHCPHLPDAPLARYAATCDCRKPGPGMLLRAMQALDIDPRRSLMVGDRLSDLQAGRNAGVLRNFLIHDHSKGEPADTGDGVFADLEALSIHFLHSSPTA